MRRDLPRAVLDELRRLGGRPVPAVVRLPAPGTRPADGYCVLVGAGLGALEQAAEYHARRALAGLEAFRRRPSAALACRLARHAAAANLARRLFNRRLGQAADADLPFPFEAAA